MKVIISRLAKLEIDEAFAYYELQYKGLGKKFREEVKKNLNLIQKYPKAWSIEKGEVRKSILHKFPHKILYSIEKDHIFIIALSHQHRKPNYWIERKID